MNLSTAFLRTFFIQSFDFSSRTTRRWLYIYSFINGLIAMGVLFTSMVTYHKLFTPEFLGTFDYIKLILIFFSILSSIAIIVRRLHDIDKSGWLFFISAIPVINILIMLFLLFPGTEGENRFGQNPREYDSFR